jgi:hypothetical protein
MFRPDRRRLVVVAAAALTLTAAGVSLARSGQHLLHQPDPEMVVGGMSDVAVNRPLAGSGRDEVAAAGSVVVQEFVDVTEDEIRLLDAESPGFLDQVILHGWQREGNRFSRQLPARGVELRRGSDEPIRIRESRFAVVLERDDRRGRESLARDDKPFDVTFEDTPLPHAGIEFKRSVSPRNGAPVTIDVTVSINYRDIKTGMCHLDQQQPNRRIQTNASPMAEARCLDYNGPYSDGKNYTLSDIRAWRNAIFSDCDLALSAGYCWTEHITKKGCYATHGNRVCSALIGHSSSYHKHRL